MKSADCLKEAQSATQIKNNVSTSPAGVPQAACCSAVDILKKPGQAAAWFLIIAKKIEFTDTYAVLQ